MDTRERAWYTYGKKYEELTLASDFLFCKIMQDTELCREMLQRIMGLKLGKVQVVNAQKPIDTTFDGKSIRLDICAKMSPAISTTLRCSARIRKNCHSVPGFTSR